MNSRNRLPIVSTAVRSGPDGSENGSIEFMREDPGGSQILNSRLLYR